jgi:uncharacterized phage-like protein YoqJ
MVIHPGLYRFPLKEAAQDNDVYILPRIGSTCAIIPRGKFSHDHETLARYVYYLKGYIEERCAENITIYMVILRGSYDILTAETILHVQKTHRQIKLICVEVSDTHFLKLKPPLRDRYMSILKQADELHQYELDLDLGEAEMLALIHADKLLYIMSEETIHVWQEMINTIWVDLLHHSGQIYKITQCWIVYIEWIMHQDIDDIII